MFTSGQPEVNSEPPLEMMTPGGGSLDALNEGEGPRDELCRLLPVACQENTNSSGLPTKGEGEGGGSGSGKSSGCEQSGSKSASYLFILLLALLMWRREETRA